MNYQNELKTLFRELEEKLQHSQSELEKSQLTCIRLKNENKELVTENEASVISIKRFMDSIEKLETAMNTLKTENLKYRKQIAELLRLTGN